MSDELDARLLSCFAASRRPLVDPQFVAQVMSELKAGRERSLSEVLRGAVHALSTGLATGIATPMRLRYAGLMALVVAAVAVWSLLQGV